MRVGIVLVLLVGLAVTAAAQPNGLGGALEQQQQDIQRQQSQRQRQNDVQQQQLQRQLDQQEQLRQQQHQIPQLERPTAPPPPNCVPTGFTVVCR